MGKLIYSNLFYIHICMNIHILHINIHIFVSTYTYFLYIIGILYLHIKYFVMSNLDESFSKCVPLKMFSKKRSL